MTDRLGVHDDRADKPFATLPPVPEVSPLVDWHGGQFPPFDRHVFLVPAAKLLAVLPSAGDRLVLRRFDPAAD